MTTKIMMNGRLYTSDQINYIGGQLKLAGLDLTEANVGQWEREMAELNMREQ
jgi:hypothetical protein